MQTIAQMSCNPAMGGVAKGQITREVDALADIQEPSRQNNDSASECLQTGPAMWSPRAQSDRL